LNAFDPITYAKGKAVLGMFERWVSEAVFQRGVQRYLTTHAHKNATAADFLAALSTKVAADAARRPTTGGAAAALLPAFSSFLDQAGVPVVSMDVLCDGAGARLKLQQGRYLPLGSAGAPPQRWRIPVCVRFGLAGQARTTCTLLS